MMLSIVGIAGRGVIRTIRMPSVLIQSVFFPTFFFVIYIGLYAGVITLGGFGTSSIENWYVPFMMLQGASFAGIGVGFSTSLDISNGFFDRLMMSPVSRIAILVGSIFGGLLRALFVSTVVLAVGLIFGARPTSGIMGFFWLYTAVVGMCLASSCWALGLVYRFKDQRIAPLFPIGVFMALFTSTAQVPLNVSTGWLQTIAQRNPVTEVLGLARQSFMDVGVTSAETIDGLIALLLIVLSLGAFAWSGLRRYLG
tara:strand:+ start:851 stop:1612 length:762 start_codon:yes stop_codon:yes gene_type:complete